MFYQAHVPLSCCRRCDRPRSHPVTRDHYACYHPCDPLRFKYACFDCRRVFKHRAPLEYNEYMFGRPVLVRPGPARIPDVWHTYHVLLQDHSKWECSPDSELGRMRAKTQLYLESLRSRGPTLTAEELQELKQHMPDAWWRPLGPHCPQCDKQGSQVGTAFEAPPRSDARAWKKLQAWEEDNGENRERESVRRELRNAERQAKQAWSLQGDREREKHRRIETLRKAVELGVRTSEEERRLSVNVIRERRGPARDAWTVVV